jgi:indolepyruvate ferredoxin oxidoreductase, beta subunit
MIRADVLVAGIGGQGVMTAAELLARAALACGLDATKTEVSGMAQRGGVVCSQVRIAPRVAATDIAPGSAHLLIALEAAEALRWRAKLAPGGVALVSTLRSVPPVVSSGLYEYPPSPLEALAAEGVQAIEIDAAGIAAELGDPRLVNTVMLGAGAARLPLPAAAIKAQVLERFRADARLAGLNSAAFDRGYRLATLQ